MTVTAQPAPEDLYALLEDMANEGQHLQYAWRTQSTSQQRILAATPERQRQFVLLAAQWLEQPQPPNQYYRSAVVHYSLSALLKRKLPFTHDEVLWLLAWSLARRYESSSMFHMLQFHLQEHLLTPELQTAISDLVRKIEAGYTDAARRRVAIRLRELGGLMDASLPLVAGEAWSDAALADLHALDAAAQAAWALLIQHCASARGSKPSAKWLKQAGALVQPIGFQTFKQYALKWFALFDKPPTQPARPGQYQNVNERNADVVKGLAWVCAEHADGDSARALVALAVSAYRKVPGMGPRCARVANACVWALGHMPCDEGIRQLVVLRTKVKLPSAQKEIEKAIGAAAERMAVPRAEVEEMTAPTYGMDEVGVRRESLGDVTAELTVAGTSDVALRWLKPDGKAQSSVPAIVKENFADDLKALKQTAKDVEKMLPAQRDRIENLYLEEKRWDYATWRARYLDHPLVGTLARRLIWQFASGERRESGIWFEGRMVAHDGRPLDWLDASNEVRLWHPLSESTETVLGWRHWLVEHLVQQPFKQAHREVYLLTDAERRTRTYSNRFAAHILRQHQFNALCAARGWKNQLRLMVDNTYPPAMRLLPKYNLRAEFWVEGAGTEYGTDTNETGTYLYVSTDQVRFYAMNAAENYADARGGGYAPGPWRRHADNDPLALEYIPPLVFSEIMRDVDLFVGVASVGNDPTWADGRSVGQYQDYWRHFSFGELSESAKTRKQILEGLVPHLKIAARSTLTDRFLIVKGDIRTYKIHLGSGNIMMEPNDQYLCIVPRQGLAAAPGGSVFLPFEGDQTLAVILSKAFLLADDKKITDPSITRQLGR